MGLGRGVDLDEPAQVLLGPGEVAAPRQRLRLHGERALVARVERKRAVDVVEQGLHVALYRAQPAAQQQGVDVLGLVAEHLLDRLARDVVAPRRELDLGVAHEPLYVGGVEPNGLGVLPDRGRVLLELPECVRHAVVALGIVRRKAQEIEELDLGLVPLLGLEVFPCAGPVFGDPLLLRGTRERAPQEQKCTDDHSRSHLGSSGPPAPPYPAATRPVRCSWGGSIRPIHPERNPLSFRGSWASPRA